MSKPSGTYLDEIHIDIIYKVVEIDEEVIASNPRPSAKLENDDSGQSGIKEVMTPFGYTVKVGGLNGRVGVKQNKKP
jgi:hypothetical protein